MILMIFDVTLGIYMREKKWLMCDDTAHDRRVCYFHCLRIFCDRITPDTPFSNFVLKITLALLNIPSFSETIMNCGKMERETEKLD